MSVFLFINNCRSQIFPAPNYSRPGISPAAQLDPEDDQLNPNLISAYISLDSLSQAESTLDSLVINSLTEKIVKM